MKSTGMTRVETFNLAGTNSVGAASLRIPRPYMARSFATTGAPSTDANLVLSGPVTGIDEESYSNVSVSGTSITSIDSTYKLSENMLATGLSVFRNGSSIDLNLISEVSSRTGVSLLTSPSSDGTIDAIFTHSGNTPRTQSSGNYPGKSITLPPASGKLHCDIDGLDSSTINYSSWEIDSNTPYKWNFYITGTDEASMPSVTQFSEYLVAGHTTGDGLGQNVRIMWMMFNSASNSNDLVMSIKSWETGETLFKQSTPNYSGNNPYSNLQMKIPVGGIFCKGGAVFDFGDSVIASFAISSLSVGYQL